jgi:glycosyltransferase involved in cell wall biosynthesis
MHQLLSEIDAIGLPSRYPKGFPGSSLNLMEAGASEVVPIASDFPGPRALIEEDDSSIMLQEPLAQNLVSAMKRLAFDKALTDRLSAGARRRVETGSVDVMVACC